MTYTVAILPVTRAAFDEIRTKLENVDYHHAIEYKDGKAVSVDMTHIAIVPLAEKLTLDNAPLGTKAPSINGGHWTKVRHGWKWCTGSTFPQPGGDWNGSLVPPDTALSEERVDEFMHWLDSRRDATVSECFHDIVAMFQGGDIPSVPVKKVRSADHDLLDGVPEHLR